jgi:hypothetical protein
MNFSEVSSSINLNYCPEFRSGSGTLIDENEIFTAVKIQTVVLTNMTTSSEKKNAISLFGAEDGMKH